MAKSLKIENKELYLYEKILNIPWINNGSSITSMDIYSMLNESEKTVFSKNNITRVLNRLKDSWKLEKTNDNVKYIIDSKEDTPIYGRAIKEKFSNYLDLFLFDAKKDIKIFKVLKEKLEYLVLNYEIKQTKKDKLIEDIRELSQIDDLNLFVTRMLRASWNTNSYLFKFYIEIINELISIWLYNNSKEYWILKRQNTANKYRLSW